jgi:phage baseplate assembly protein W
LAARLPDSLLGTGWGFPPEFRLLTGSVRLVSGIEDIRESLRILFGTQPGERVMLPEYGCDLQRFVFRPLSTALIEEVRDTVTMAIERWEARIDLMGCEVFAPEQRPATIDIDVDFRIRKTRTRGNFVYPFSLSDPSAPGEA